MRDLRTKRAGCRKRRPAACEALEGRLLLSSQPASAPGWLTLSSSFETINYDGNVANTGTPDTPASPSAAAGPAHLLTAVNSSIEWYSKSGTRQHSEALADFFSPLNATGDISDPKTLYDPYSNRFLVLAIDQAPQPRILLAASDDSDPNGTWYFQAIDAAVAGAGSAAEGAAIAADANALYITADLFASADHSFQGSRLWILGKASLYAGGAADYAVYNPAEAAGVTQVCSFQPAQPFGTTPPSLGTFLVGSGFSDAAGDDYLSVIRVDDPLGSPIFTNSFVALGDIDSGASLPDAPQPLVPTLIDTGDKRITSAVWRNGVLYAANTINPASGLDAGQATAHWYRINTPASGALTLADQGDIGGEELGYTTFTYDPSIAADAAGNIAVGFSASGPYTYAGAYFTGRLHNDAAGTSLSAVVLRAGVDAYVRPLANGENAWGNSSSTVLDPADGQTFWTFNAYAMPRGSELNGEDGRWGTALGSFQLAGVSQAGGISGSVYYDLNSTGSRDGGEVGLGGRTVYLDQNQNGVFDASTTEETSADIPKPLDDQTTITSDIVFSGLSGTISSLELTLDIAHTDDSDLKAYLISPSGTRVLLFSRVGADGHDFTGTTFTDRAAASIVDGTAPFSGQYRPAEPFSKFSGESANGTWRLEISDLAAAGVGTLNAWSMKLATSEPYAITDDAGRYQFSGLMPGTYRVAEDLPDGWTMTTPGFSDVNVNPGTVSPGGNFGNYAAPAAIGGSIYDDANANGLRDTLEGGLGGWQAYLDSNNNGQFDSVQKSYDAMSLPVADASTIRSTLHVADTPGTIQNLTLKLNLAHPKTSDLTVYLISPAGTRIQLFDQAGDGGANFTNTTFDDLAPNGISTGQAPFTGSYRPAQALSTLDGQSANGDWTLEVVDHLSSGQAKLLGWSLNVYSSEPVVEADDWGYYRFSDLPAGTYTVREVNKSGWLATAPAGGYYAATVGAGDWLTIADFGNTHLAEIHGTVFGDLDGNGLRDASEPGLSDWTVFLDLNGNGIRDLAGATGESEPAVTSSLDGSYAFAGLLPGTYHVRQIPQAGWQQTMPVAASYDLDLTGQDVKTGLDFGNHPIPGEIRGVLFNDINGNGTQDPNETGIAGWRVYIDANMNGAFDAGERSVLSGTDGSYAFTGLEPGTYVIAQIPQQGWMQTYPSSPTSAGAGSIQNVDLPASQSSSIPYGASSDDTSEFMIGDVWVNVVLMESDGSIDPSTENWTAAQTTQVESEIQEGLDWWQQMFAAQAASGHLAFHTDFTYADRPVPTGYEPITHSSTDQYLWIDDFLTRIGYDPSAGYMSELTRWNNAQRLAHHTQWAFTIFVVNSAADADGQFTDGEFAYSYLGGPMAVMTYNNDGWGIDNMGQVVAHETGHIFYALDEYSGASTYSERSGYYNTQNLNANDGNPRPSQRVPSIMAEPSLQNISYPQYKSSPTSLQMVGWRDLDGDGIFDVLDVPLTLSGSGRFDPLTRRYEFTGASSVATLPSQNPWGNGHRITINRVDRVQYRLDGSAWIDGSEYGTYSASIVQSVPVAADGMHRIDFRTICNDTGVVSPIWSDTFTVMSGVQTVTVSAGQVFSDVSFGSRQQAAVSEIDGTDGDDHYYVRLNSNGTAIEVLTGSGPDGSTAYVIPLGSIPSLTFNLKGGNDSITAASDTTGIGLLKIIASGSAILNFTGGTSTVDAGVGGNVSIHASGDAVVNLAAPQQLAMLSIDGSARVNVPADGSHILRVNGLDIGPGGALDLFDNNLVVQAPDAATRDAWLATIANLIRQSHNTTPAWSGPGIGSSTARTDGLTGLAAIANIDAAGNPLYPYDPTDLAHKPGWQGQPVDANSILVMYTFNGDADLNGVLDGSDYFQIDKGFLSRNSANPPGGYRNGDFNYDGVIDGSDYFLIDKAFLSQTTHVPPPPLAASIAPTLFGSKPIKRHRTLAARSILSVRSHGRHVKAGRH